MQLSWVTCLWYCNAECQYDECHAWNIWFGIKFLILESVLWGQCDIWRYLKKKLYVLVSISQFLKIRKKISCWVQLSWVTCLWYCNAECQYDECHAWNIWFGIKVLILESVLWGQCVLVDIWKKLWSLVSISQFLEKIK